MVLRELAEKYDSAEGRYELQLLRQGWEADSEPSIPARWMLAQADRIDPSGKDWDFNEVAL
jgi:hypothetical protein